MSQKNIIKASLFTPVRNGWGLALLAWAEPGVGKTSIIEEICADYAMPVECFAVSERGEGAVGQVPVPDMGLEDYSYLAALSEKIVAFTDAGMDSDKALKQAIATVPRTRDMVLRYPRPEWTDKFMQGGRGVVFVDELTSAAPAIMPALMGLFLAKRIGGCRLPGGVRMLAAANPPELAASGYDLPHPLANRMGHISWHTPTVDEHVSFMLRGTSGFADTTETSFDAEVEEKRVLAGWGNAWAKAVGLETAFLQRRPQLKNMCPKVGDPKATRAWPSDRTWEMATRAMASAEVHDLSAAEREEFVAAFIGEGPAGEWFTYCQEQDLPDPTELLDGKASFTHNPQRIDRTIAVIQSCVALVSPRSAVHRSARGGALWNLLDKFAGDKADLDIVVPGVHAMIEADLHLLKEATKPMAKIQPVLKKAGITASRRGR